MADRHKELDLSDLVPHLEVSFFFFFFNLAAYWYVFLQLI